MRQATYIPFMLFVLILAGASACKKKEDAKPAQTQAATTEPVVTEPDNFPKIAGEWKCAGENKAMHVNFTSATTWTVMDTDIVLSDFIMKVEKVNDLKLQVTCMGYDRYMTYTNLGVAFEKCETTSDANKIEYRAGGYDSHYGYGSGRLLMYYIKEDSIYYFSDYRSNTDRFDVVIRGHRN